MNPVLPGHRLAEPLGETDPSERPAIGDGVLGGNNPPTQRRPAKLDHDNLQHRERAGRKLVYIKIVKIDWVKVCPFLMRLTRAERQPQYGLRV